MIRFKSASAAGKAPEQRAPAPARARDKIAAEATTDDAPEAKKSGKTGPLSKAGRAARTKGKPAG